MFLPWEINILTLVPQWWHKEKRSVNFDINNMYWSATWGNCEKTIGEWMDSNLEPDSSEPSTIFFHGATHQTQTHKGCTEEDKIFLRRSQKVLLRDGSVVLSAENVAFRIRKSQLAHRSAIFYEVLHLVVHPWIFRKMFDGPSAVPIHDTPNHVLELLQSVHDSPLMLTQAMFW